MIQTETIQQVIRTLGVLPPKCRQVFKMFYFQGKTHEEIAHELNLSPHTVRNQRIRAVRLLKKKATFLLSSLMVIFY
jgi:RNA polymerase sigma-70 factor (ECF subfamily)